MGTPTCMIYDIKRKSFKSKHLKEIQTYKETKQENFQLKMHSQPLISYSIHEKVS